MGGKFYQSNWIISFFPHHSFYGYYIEICGGTFSIGLQLPDKINKICNDLWNDIINLFKQLKNNNNKLREWLSYHPVSQRIYQEFFEKYKSRNFENDLERAGVIFYLLNLSYNAMIGSGIARILPPDSSHDIGRGFTRKVDDIPWFINKLRNVLFESYDFGTCIKKYDSKTSLIYADPPYILPKKTKTQSYYYEADISQPENDWTRTDMVQNNPRVRLANSLNKCKGFVVISYYQHPLLDKLYPKNKWYRFEKVFQKFSVQGSTNDKGRELLLLNYNHRDFKKIDTNQQTIEGLI
jgi:DNA adenine methylase